MKMSSKIKISVIMM